MYFFYSLSDVGAMLVSRAVEKPAHSLLYTQKSVNAYFESKKGGVRVLQDGDDPELVITFNSKMVSALENATVSTVAPKQFKLLTWNIDGLDRTNLKKRAKAVIKIIEKY